MHDYLCMRFDDPAELKDVANYGCSGGVSGFIYSTELAEFFDAYEEQIEDIMDMAGITYQDLVPEAQTMQQYKEAAVWFAVEDYCQSLAIEAEMNEYLAAA